MNANPFKNPAHASNVKRWGVLAGSVLTMMQHAEREGHAHTGKELAEALPMFPAALIRKARGAMRKAGAVYQWKGHWRPKVGNPGPGEFLHGPHASADQRIAAKDALEAAAAFYGREDLVTKPRKLRGFKMPKSFVDIGDFVAVEYDSDKFDGKQRIYRHEGEVKRRFLLSTDGSVAIFQPPFGLTEKGIEG
jgi:hypothetical protein